MATRAYLQTADGQGAEAVIEDDAMPEDMQPWADSACEAYGLKPGSLTAVIVAGDDPDPRKGTLLTEPKSAQAAAEPVVERPRLTDEEIMALKALAAKA